MSTHGMPVSPQQVPRRKSRISVTLIVVGAALLLLCLCGGAFAIFSFNDSANKMNVTAPSAAATWDVKSTHAVQQNHSPVQLLNFSGSGVKKSAVFTVAGEWTLSYTFDCTKYLGGTGNFIVAEYTSPSGAPIDILVNRLGDKGEDTVPQHSDTGSRYIEINSECPWTVTANG